MRTAIILLALAFAAFGGGSGGLIDINHASLAELKSLPGIREPYALAIVKNRPYKNKAQLLSKQVIPAAEYKQIRNRIIAKQ